MELLPIPGAEIYYEAQFIVRDESDRIFDVLAKKCAWERRMGPFGNPVPRDEAYYGDADAHYTYSRRAYIPLPWIPELLSLKASIEKATPAIAYENLKLPITGYNAVLCNLYRNGDDSVGLHADAEPEMGPVIASLSLGAERLFRLKRRKGSVVFSERLSHGSLLIMAGETQKRFQHEVPKEPEITLPRINLTFRSVRHKT
jgi:alkylated DNA repair dioxygenase AlkB